MLQASLRRHRHDFHLFVKNNSREWIELADPGRTIENRPGVRITCVPALHNAGWAEIDVLGVALHFQLRCQQPHHVHPGLTAISSQFSHHVAIALHLGQTRGKLADDMTQTMRLLLARNMARDPAGILHVLVPIEHFRHRGGLGAGRIPHVDREDQGILAGVVVDSSGTLFLLGFSRSKVGFLPDRSRKGADAKETAVRSELNNWSKDFAALLPQPGAASSHPQSPQGL